MWSGLLQKLTTQFLKGESSFGKLLDQNCVLAPSALVRRRCYETISMFPLDLPFAADWYLWCVFALHYDVAYFAEPMVNYRMHDLGMTNILIDKDVSMLSQDDLAVRWRLKGLIEKAGFNSLAELCEDRIVGDYIANLTSRLHKGTKGYESSGQNYVMNFAEFEHSLITNARDLLERDRIHHRVLVGIGSRFQLAFRQSAGTPGRWFRYIWRAARNPQLLINYISFVASKRSPMQRGSKDGGP